MDLKDAKALGEKYDFKDTELWDIGIAYSPESDKWKLRLEIIIKEEQAAQIIKDFDLVSTGEFQGMRGVTVQ